MCIKPIHIYYVHSMCPVFWSIGMTVIHLMKNSVHVKHIFSSIKYDMSFVTYEPINIQFLVNESHIKNSFLV